jgi:hypothetical protein
MKLAVACHIENRDPQNELGHLHPHKKGPCVNVANQSHSRIIGFDVNPASSHALLNFLETRPFHPFSTII